MLPSDSIDIFSTRLFPCPYGTHCIARARKPKLHWAQSEATGGRSIVTVPNSTLCPSSVFNH